MTECRVATTVGMLAVAMMVAGLAGCHVQVDKDKNGEEKRVQVDTPFGGLHVNTDQTSAADLGLPTYPGAVTVKGDDNNGSADVHMGFGEWQLRVRAVSYESADSQDKVVAFYKKALGHFGDVLTCHDHEAVGQPSVTSDGLTCSDDGQGSNIQVNGHKAGGSHSTELELKAGSKRHQHIVGFEKPKSGRTRFALVALDLPANTGKNKGD